MSLLPEGEALRNAVRWIGHERRERPDARVSQLVDEASRKFDLSPAEGEFLLNLLLRDGGPPEDSEPPPAAA